MATPKQIDVPTDFESFLKILEESEQRLELTEGKVVAMSGGTMNHDVISENCRANLHQQLRSKTCRVRGADALLRISHAKKHEAVFPDAAVTCYPIEGNALYYENPSLIVEVLSDSTRAADLKSKREDYFTISSLQYYLIIEQVVPQAVLYTRDGDTFRGQIFDDLTQRIVLPGIGCTLAMADLYDGVP